jgi:hypothetical protein
MSQVLRIFITIVKNDQKKNETFAQSAYEMRQRRQKMSPRKKITDESPEFIAEWKTVQRGLRGFFQHKMDKLTDGRQNAFAKELGLTKGQMSTLINGGEPISLDRLIKTMLQIGPRTMSQMFAELSHFLKKAERDPTYGDFNIPSVDDEPFTTSDVPQQILDEETDKDEDEEKEKQKPGTVLRIGPKGEDDDDSSH